MPPRAATRIIGGSGVRAMSLDPAAAAGLIVDQLRADPGARTAELRSIRRAWSARLRDAPAADVIAVANALIDAGSVPRFIACELIEAHPGARSAIDTRTVRRLGRGMASWGDVDSFAVLVAGPAWRERRIPDDEVLRWAESRDRWWRRAALVATVPLNLRSRGGTGDADRTLRICERLAGDSDGMVVKAMSWALRELAKREPDAVRHFLRQHGEAIAARIRREVRNKLSTGLKSGDRHARSERAAREGTT